MLGTQNLNYFNTSLTNFHLLQIEIKINKIEATIQQTFTHIVSIDWEVLDKLLAAIAIAITQKIICIPSNHKIIFFLIFKLGTNQIKKTTIKNNQGSIKLKIIIF